MPTQTDVYGSNFVFGFSTTDALSISIAGFSPRTMATFDTAPESFAQATNGEGLTEAVAITKPAYRMFAISLTGYISSSFQRSGVNSAFTATIDGVSRVFLMRKISTPVPKGNFVEVTIDAESFALIDSTTAH